MADITMYFESNHVGPPVTIRIGIDNIEYHQAQLPVDQIQFQADLSAGAHVLWIQYGFKHPENEIRENGKLIKDTDVNIRNICIDSCMMGHLVNDCGLVEPDWTQHQDVADYFLETQGQVPKILPKVSYLNLASTYRFQFEWPIEKFLQKHIQLHEQYAFMYNSPLERYQSLKKQILNSFDS